MHFPLKPFFVLIVLFFIVVACQKDEAFTDELTIIEKETPSPKSYPGVERALWPFFERFEQIGAAQGVPVDLVKEQITGVIEDIEGERVAGQCNFYSHSPNHVIIDSEFWSRVNDNLKELIIFHELGHCVLNRDHREGSLDNGFCLSIMRSGEQACLDAYNTNTKDYYLEELFHPGRVD